MLRNLITTSAVLAIRGKLAGQARAVFAVGFVWYSPIRALQDNMATSLLPLYGFSRRRILRKGVARVAFGVMLSRGFGRE